MNYFSYIQISKVAYVWLIVLAITVLPLSVAHADYENYSDYSGDTYSYSTNTYDYSYTPNYSDYTYSYSVNPSDTYSYSTSADTYSYSTNPADTYSYRVNPADTYGYSVNPTDTYSYSVNPSDTYSYSVNSSYRSYDYGYYYPSYGYGGSYYHPSYSYSSPTYTYPTYTYPETPAVPTYTQPTYTSPTYTQPTYTYPTTAYYPTYYPTYYSTGSVVASASTPYVTLAALPYTGLELGPVGTFLYWLFLVLWCLFAAYLIVVKRVQNKVASRLGTFLFGTAPTVQQEHGHEPAASVAAHAPETAPAHTTPAASISHDDDFIASQINRSVRR